MKIISRKQKLARGVVLPMGKKLLVWLNILLQLLFPVAVSMTPAIAASEKSAISQMATQPYELKKGETTASVAGRYQLTPDELARLNQFRTFSKPFNSLGEGAEIDVPASPVKGLPAPAAPEQTSPDTQLAQTASQFGQLMSSEDKAQSAAGMATGMVNSKVNQTVSDWLSQFGTAKVQLNTNNKFAFADSQLDVLFPLYDHGSDVFFTQSGIRDTDGRTIANLGIGDRWFTDGTMMGANLFIDRDIGRRHTRIGTGGEYWQDYLKLAANGYFAVSGWKQSRDLEDYDERPANGFDLRSDMYLPAYPQLGAKLTYEQYYGRNVGLFGKDNLQHNPAAVTAGLTYTPVPLLSFDLGQKQGEQHKHDTQLSVNLTYNFAQGFAEQLDPSMVALKRSLAGSRYDLVDRNNDIVLEYRKQELVHLKVAHSVSGMSGETKPLSVSASAKHGIEKIDYQASAGFDAAGGKVTEQHRSYTVKLPVWNEHNNHYTLTFVATDKKGNTSKPQITEITVEASPVSGDSSSLNSTLVNNSVVADGESTAQIVIKLADSNGNPATVAPESIGLTSHFDITAPGGARRLTRQHVTAVKTEPGPTLGPVTAKTDEPGTYVSVLTAGYAAGVATISAKVDEVAIKNTLTVTQTAVDIDTSSESADFSVNHDTIKADGNEQATLTFSIKDNNGKPVKNLVSAPVQLTFSLSTQDGVTLSRIEENPEGVYKAVLGGTKAQKVDVTPVVRGTQLKDNTRSVTLVADETSLTLDNGSASVTRNDAPANGTAENEITASVKDRFGNPVPGAKLTFTASNGAKVSAPASDSNGTIIAKVTSTTAGSSSVSISLSDGQSITREVNFIADTGTAQLASGSFTVVADSAPADGTSLNTVKVKVEDASGNPIKGADVTFTASPDTGITFQSATVTTGDDGYAEAELSCATAAGAVTVTASLSGTSFTDSVDVHFVGNPKTAGTTNQDIKITQNDAAANGTDQNQVQVTVRDASGNLLEGIPVTFDPGLNGIIFAKSSVNSDKDGIATVDAISTKAGNRDFTVTVNSKAYTGTMNFVGDTGTSAVNSFESADTGDLTVSGSTAHTLTATIEDTNHNLVENEPVVFKIVGDHAGVTLSNNSPVLTNNNGQATTEITSQLAGTFTIIAFVKNDVVTGKKQQVTFVADKDPATSQLTLKPVDDGAIADGAEYNSVQATLTDKFDNPLEKEAITFAADNSATLPSPTVETNSDGVAVVHITNMNAGGTSVTATWSTKTSSPQRVTFVANAGTATLLASNVTVSPSSAAANDSDVVSITAKVTDNGNNAVNDQDVTFELTSPASGATFADNSTKITVPTGSNGEAAVASVKAATAGDYTVRVSVTNINSETSSHDVVVTFTPDLATAQVTQVKALQQMLADGNENAVLAEVKDAKGNLVEGAAVTFTVDGPATFDNGQQTMDVTTTNGLAQTKVKNTVAGSVMISAVVTGSGKSPETTPVTFVADRATATIGNADFTASPDSIAANGTSTSVLTATVKDARGNPVDQQNVTFAITSGTGAKLSDTTVKTGANGNATVTLTSGTLANDVAVTASTNGHDVSKTIHLIADEATATFKGDIETSVQVLAADSIKTSTVSASIVDAKGNPVPNMPVTFMVKPATAAFTPGTGIVNTNAEGKATVDMTSSTPGDVVVTAAITPPGGSPTTKDSSPVQFVKPYIPNPSIDTVKNSHTFAASAGFPQTGFDTAAFTISPTGDAADNKLFNWKSSDSASASVEAGTITLHDKPAGEVTITATYPTGEKYEYKFTIKKWFTHGDKVGGSVIFGTQTQVKNICENTYGMKLPAKADYSDGKEIRSIGKVFGEWGDLRQWGWKNDSGYNTTFDWYYTSNATTSGVYVNDGDISATSSAESIYPAACMR